MKVEFVTEKMVPADVTDTHVFLGYKPVVIAVSFPVTETGHKTMEREWAQLNFYHRLSHECKLATLELKCVHQLLYENRLIIFYQGARGTHKFMNSFHQFVNQLRESAQKAKPGNVSLPGNEADQVRIAYSFPRTISLITIEKDNLFNLFPTDLHGPVTDTVYAGSLRIGGKANAQVEEGGRIVISEMLLQKYQYAYSLGRNHMKDHQAREAFEFTSQQTFTLNLPIPEGAKNYRELERFDSFDIGIHRIHLYKVLYFETMSEGPTLAHIDRYYAQWRTNHQLNIQLLLR